MSSHYRSFFRFPRICQSRINFVQINPWLTALVKLTEECTNGCFGSFSKNGREFWPISLHVIDSLAFLLDLPSPNLWLKYSQIYKRYKEFKKIVGIGIERRIILSTLYFFRKISFDLNYFIN